MGEKYGYRDEVIHCAFSNSSASTNLKSVCVFLGLSFFVDFFRSRFFSFWFQALNFKVYSVPSWKVTNISLDPCNVQGLLIVSCSDSSMSSPFHPLTYLLIYTPPPKKNIYIYTQDGFHLVKKPMKNELDHIFSKLGRKK